MYSNILSDIKFHESELFYSIVDSSYIVREIVRATCKEFYFDINDDEEVYGVDISHIYSKFLTRWVLGKSWTMEYALILMSENFLTFTNQPNGIAFIEKEILGKGNYGLFENLLRNNLYDFVESETGGAAYFFCSALKHRNEKLASTVLDVLRNEQIYPSNVYSPVYHECIVGIETYLRKFLKKAIHTYTTENLDFFINLDMYEDCDYEDLFYDITDECDNYHDATQLVKSREYITDALNMADM